MSGYFSPYFGAQLGSIYFGGSGGSTPPVDPEDPDAEIGEFPRASMLVDTDNLWHFKVYIGDTLAVDFNCGVGYDESATVNLTDLAATVNAVSSLSMTIAAGAESIPAAFIPTFEDTQFVEDTTLNIEVFYWEEIPKPTGVVTFFPGLLSNRETDHFENASAASINDTLYVGGGYDPIVKYDGNKQYLAGVPPLATAPTVALVAGGALTLTDAKYRVQYVHFDAQGLEQTGIISGESAELDPSGENVRVTVSSIEADSGYNTDFGFTAASPSIQIGTTIQMAPGHTIKAGDRVFFRDSSSVETFKTVQSVTTNTITVDSSASLSASSVISSGLAVRLYRSTDGSDFFDVGVFPHPSGVGTFNIIDSQTVDGEIYVPPAVLPGLPPNLRYLCIHQNMLLGCVGETVYHSAPGRPESFSSSRSFDLFDTPGPLTALSPCGEFLVPFKRSSYYVVIGDLDTAGAYRTPLESKDIGCVSHASLIDIGGPIIFLDRRGPHIKTTSELARSISEELFPVFKDGGWKLQRSVGVNNSSKQEYWIYLPKERGTGVARYATEESRIYVYNWFREKWVSEWTGMNLAGGATVANDEVWWCNRALSPLDSQVYSRAERQLNNDSWIDYTDHVEVAEMSYAPGWEAGDDPRVQKLFTRFKLYSNDPVKIASFNLGISIEHDWVPGVTRSAFDFLFGSGTSTGGWGNGAWGLFPWGDPTQPFKDIHLKSGLGKSVRPVFRHQERYMFPLISGWEFEMSVPSKLRMARR